MLRGIWTPAGGPQLARAARGANTAHRAVVVMAAGVGEAWCWPASARCGDTVVAAPRGAPGGAAPTPVPVHPVVQGAAAAALAALPTSARRWAAGGGGGFAAKPGQVVLVPGPEVRGLPGARQWQGRRLGGGSGSVQESRLPTPPCVTSCPSPPAPPPRKGGLERVLLGVESLADVWSYAALGKLPGSRGDSAGDGGGDSGASEGGGGRVLYALDEAALAAGGPEAADAALLGWMLGGWQGGAGVTGAAAGRRGRSEGPAPQAAEGRWVCPPPVAALPIHSPTHPPRPPPRDLDTRLLQV
jgi:hypothetical protein